MEIPIRVIYPEETHKVRELEEKLIEVYFKQLQKSLEGLTVLERDALLQMLILELKKKSDSN